jgi:hypothetical protein
LIDEPSIRNYPLPVQEPKAIACRFDNRFLVIDYGLKSFFVTKKPLENSLSNVFVTGLVVAKVRVKQ